MDKQEVLEWALDTGYDIWIFGSEIYTLDNTAPACQTTDKALKAVQAPAYMLPFCRRSAPRIYTTGTSRSPQRHISRELTKTMGLYIGWLFILFLQDICFSIYLFEYFSRLSLIYYAKKKNL
jgi:hypothetical protein